MPRGGSCGRTSCRQSRCQLFFTCTSRQERPSLPARMGSGRVGSTYRHGEELREKRPPCVYYLRLQLVRNDPGGLLDLEAEMVIQCIMELRCHWIRRVPTRETPRRTVHCTAYLLSQDRFLNARILLGCLVRACLCECKEGNGGHCRGMMLTLTELHAFRWRLVRGVCGVRGRILVDMVLRDAFVMNSACMAIGERRKLRSRCWLLLVIVIIGCEVYNLGGPLDSRQGHRDGQ